MIFSATCYSLSWGLRSKLCLLSDFSVIFTKCAEEPNFRSKLQLYLPPYSPDLNPIEKAWAKLKQLLRSAKARAAQALDQSNTELLPNIRPRNAQAWFRTPFQQSIAKRNTL